MLVHLENTTKKLCVIGDPVLHSRSPLIQNAMLAELGLDYLYMAQYVPRGGAAAWLEAAKCAGYAGFNATMPHKLELVPLMDELGEDARMYGAVNTVVLRDGRASGHNTDGRGFVRALADMGVEPGGLRVLLLGAGGAAKSVALKLAQCGAEQVFICNRTAERAAGLCAQGPEGRLTPAELAPETLCRLAAQCDLVVNCTSRGMEGAAEDFEDLSFLERLPAGAAVCDLIYAPAETALLKTARELGHPAQNGLGMLIYQGVYALELFTGVALDTARMRAVCEAALEAET